MRRILIGLIIVALTIVSAYFLGTAAARYVSSLKEQKLRSEHTQEVTAQMKNLKLGDTIPDHTFQDLAGRTVRLSEQLCGRTVVTFFEPDCHTCIDEIAALKAYLRDTAHYAYFVFVSSYDLTYLNYIKEKMRVPLAILRDEAGQYASNFGVYTYPFSLIVSQKRELLTVSAGCLTDSEFEDILKTNRPAGTLKQR